ncbi:MAG: BamA/TamA family outer membrane protein [Myxococcota bacterium]|nr:BamA/TamA family outer membrane protein [Myxococcota bacterium]
MVALFLTIAHAEEPRDPLSWYALPTIDYSSDFGLGGGLASGLYFERPDMAPYKAAVELDLYATTKRVQEHSLWFEVLQLAEQPLRLQAEVGFLATVSDNYCGVAGEPDCTTTAGDRNLLRYSAPTARVAALWSPLERAGVMAGLEGAVYRPGVFNVTTPYPDSLYAEAFPDGEQGRYTAAMVGLLTDSRDDEINPTRGLRADASVRGGGGVIGSAWTSLGLNASGIGFAPITPHLTAATRLVFDAIWGEVPTPQLGQFGGWSGGQGMGGDMGRGIRSRRYIGRRKALGQQELRWMPLTVDIARTAVTLGGVGFFDAGHVSDTDAAVTAWGTGAGIRVDIGGDFLMRYDLGLSPVEGWQPYSYIDFGHAF